MFLHVAGKERSHHETSSSSWHLPNVVPEQGVCIQSREKRDCDLGIYINVLHVFFFLVLHYSCVGGASCHLLHIAPVGHGDFKMPVQPFNCGANITYSFVCNDDNVSKDDKKYSTMKIIILGM